MKSHFCQFFFLSAPLSFSSPHVTFFIGSAMPSKKELARNKGKTLQKANFIMQSFCNAKYLE